MNQLLLTLGGLTLGGSAAVLLLAWTGRSGRYGARWRCWAWALLCLRLAIPLPLLPQIQTRAPIQVDIPAPPSPAPPAVPGLPKTEPGGAFEPSAGGLVPPGDNAEGFPSDSSAPAGVLPARPKRAVNWTRLLTGVWLAGAAAVLLWSAAVHLRFSRWLRRWGEPVAGGEAIAALQQMGDRLGLNRRPRLLVCWGVKAPMLAGLFQPAILLPRDSLSGEELGLSLLHELTHYRRRDIWRKTLALWACALHWFNPLMWYMLRLVERDTELACDEDALRRLNRADYAAYGQTVLNAVARQKERRTP